MCNSRQGSERSEMSHSLATTVISSWEKTDVSNSDYKRLNKFNGFWMYSDEVYDLLLSTVRCFKKTEGQTGSLAM